MKPRTPFVQTFEQLPQQLPIYRLENALLPGGELPLELAKPADLALFIKALKTDQLIGMLQPLPNTSGSQTYQIGCAGRIRQYRERKDGRLNVMLTGICRYRVIEKHPQADDYLIASVDWSDYAIDYQSEDVHAQTVDTFKADLRAYFDRHAMQADWDVLNKLPIEQVVNNLVLIMNMQVEDKQRLLESPTLTTRIQLFSEILNQKAAPIIAASALSRSVN